MKIKLTQLIKAENAQIDINYECDLSDAEVWGEKLFAEPVRVTGSIRNRAEVIELVLNLQITADTACARCLKPVREVLSVDVSYDVVTELQNPDDEHLLLIEGDELDVDETVRTAVLLNMPMRFLCSENCKGLCSKCGADLNEGECACDKHDIDPRLAILKTLL